MTRTAAATPRRHGRRISILSVFIAIVVLGAAGTAFAVWSGTFTDMQATAYGDSIQAGSTPSLTTQTGRNVTISWPQRTAVLNSGTAATGYSVNRWNAPVGGSATAATNGCSGTIAALTCTESNVPTGTWYYAVTPHLNSWAGAESGRLAVTVTAATFSITASQNLSAVSLPANITGGAVTQFASNENLTFHLDTTSGTVLTTTPTTVTTGAGGTASGVNISIPTNTVGGTHTIWAVGNTSSLQAQSNSFTITSSLSFTTSQSFSTLPATLLGGNAAGFGASENVTFHLDTSGGTVLASTPSPVTTNSGGTTPSFTVTIPTGVASGTHTVVAVGNTSGLTATSNTFTVTTTSLAITSVVRDAGNEKFHFTGTGASGATAVTVTICTANSFPCTGPNTAGTSVTATSPPASWTSGQDSNNLTAGTQYWAQATQGAATSAVFPFVAEPTEPSPVNVALANGGTLKKADAGDTVTVTFSEPLDASTLCSAWNNTGTQTITNANIRFADAGSDDTFTVTSAATCTGNGNFGTVGTGGNYVSPGGTDAADFSNSTIAWNPASYTLTFTLGTVGSTTNIQTNVTAGTPDYTAVAAMKDLAGDIASTTKITSGTTTGF